MERNLLFNFLLFPLCLQFFIIAASPILQAQSSNKSDNFIFKKSKIEPKQIFTIDSSKIDTIIEEAPNAQFLPGKQLPSNLFSPEQDSLLARAQRLKIPVAVRLRNDLKLFSENWKYHIQSLNNPLWAAAEDNMRIPSAYLMPLGNELVQRQMMISDAQYSPVHRSPRVNTGGFSTDFLAVLFGMKEDLSPVMKYGLDESEEVEIVIYSIQAVVVANLFKGRQTQGNYKIIWDGKNNNGKPLPNVDYIGEVRIGRKKYYRKPIRIPIENYEFLVK